MTERPISAVIEQRLRLAIDPYGERLREDLDMLLWRAGRMREQIDSAHHWLDMKGAPRETGDGALTLRGRMDALAERSIMSQKASPRQVRGVCDVRPAAPFT